MNYFIGLPYYLLPWIFSWGVLTPFLNGRTGRSRMKQWALLLVLCTYVGFSIYGGFQGVQNWPASEQTAAEHNRQVTQQIAADLRAILGNNDTFTWVPAFGYPAALQYYMVDSDGGYPNFAWIDIAQTPDQAIHESVSKSKAILVYKEDIDEVSRFSFVPLVTRPYWRAIAEWVRQPANSYVPIKTYDLSFPDGNRLTIGLYVKQNG